MDRPHPDVNFATTRDGLRIGYAVQGGGPPLVFVRALNSHAEQWWNDVWTGPYLSALGRAFSVVLFDARGNGLSDPCLEIDLDALVEDLRAVVEHAGLESFTLFGQGFGSPVAIAYAAREPDRVERLILYCAYARGAGTVIADEFIETLLKLPQAAVAMMSRLSYPDARQLPVERLDAEHAHFTPETGAAYFEFVRSVDVRDALPDVRAPTLVMQPLRNPTIPDELGREVAEGIGGSTFLSVRGGAYNPWAEEAVDPTLEAIGAFVGVDLPSIPAPKRLAVLVTDMVASTAMHHRVGEERAHGVHRVHDELVKRALDVHRGTHVKRTGDGTMAVFADPGDAVACAVEIQTQLAERAATSTDEALRVRIGVAMGDVWQDRDDVFGTTVVMAVRLVERASAGQVLVSEAVRDAAGGVFEFGPGRSRSLKGFPDRVKVSEVLWSG